MGQCLSSSSSSPSSSGTKGKPDPATEDAVFASLRKEPLANNYTLSKDARLGHGNQGTVKVAVSIDDPSRSVAVKSLDVGMFCTALARTCAANEVLCMRRMSHPNVVKLLDAFYDKSQSKIHIVMENIRGPRMTKLLATQMPSNPEEAARLRHSLVLQLVDAVAHIHSRGVIYRDLHPENTMVALDENNNYTLKIIDFGSALPLQRSERLGQVPQLGSSLFQAPEVEESLAYGQQADMWGVGVFSYLILTGDMPFSHNIHGIYQALEGRYFPLPDGFDADARDFIAKLISVNPSKRMNASQCRRHRFLRVGGMQGLARTLSLGALQRGGQEAPTTAFDAIEAQIETTRKCVHEMAKRLNREEVCALREWLHMVSERSVHNDSTTDQSGSGGGMYMAYLQQKKSHEGSAHGSGRYSREGSARGCYMRDSSAHYAGPLRYSASMASLLDDDEGGEGQHQQHKSNLMAARTVPLGLAHRMGLCSFGELLSAFEANGHRELMQTLRSFHDKILVESVADPTPSAFTLSTEAAVFRIDDLVLATEKRQEKVRSRPATTILQPAGWDPEAARAVTTTTSKDAMAAASSRWRVAGHAVSFLGAITEHKNPAGSFSSVGSDDGSVDRTQRRSTSFDEASPEKEEDMRALSSSGGGSLASLKEGEDSTTV